MESVNDVHAEEFAQAIEHIQSMNKEIAAELQAIGEKLEIAGWPVGDQLTTDH
jgi:hypothetical protein